MSEPSHLLGNKGPQTSIKSSYLSLRELGLSSELLKEKTELYKKQDEALESLFQQVRIYSAKHGNLSIKLQEFLNLNPDDSADQIILDQAEKVIKQKHFKAELLNCLRQYTKLNEEVSKQIQIFQSEAQNSRENVLYALNLADCNLNKLRMKVEKYEETFNNSMHKYPWLNEESLEMGNIKRQLDQLENLKKEKNALLKELNVFKNLEPDVNAAKQKLGKVKQELLAADKALLD